MVKEELVDGREIGLEAVGSHGTMVAHPRQVARDVFVGDVEGCDGVLVEEKEEGGHIGPVVLVGV